LHPEIDHLLQANPQLTCLKAGTSDLGQSTFKVIRSTNLMRFQQAQAEQETQAHYLKLREEMMGRQSQF